jgi:hypothetical protein
MAPPETLLGSSAHLFHAFEEATPTTLVFPEVPANQLLIRVPGDYRWNVSWQAGSARDAGVILACGILCV